MRTPIYRQSVTAPVISPINCKLYSFYGFYIHFARFLKKKALTQQHNLKTVRPIKVLRVRWPLVKAA